MIGCLPCMPQILYKLTVSFASTCVLALFTSYVLTGSTSSTMWRGPRTTDKCLALAIYLAYCIRVCNIPIVSQLHMHILYGQAIEPIWKMGLMIILVWCRPPSGTLRMASGWSGAPSGREWSVSVDSEGSRRRTASDGETVIQLTVE
jgi:hypothetical protein